jgi:hypothetical protein
MAHHAIILYLILPTVAATLAGMLWAKRFWIEAKPTL